MPALSNTGRTVVSQILTPRRLPPKGLTNTSRRRGRRPCCAMAACMRCSHSRSVPSAALASSSCARGGGRGARHGRWVRAGQARRCSCRHSANSQAGQRLPSSSSSSSTHGSSAPAAAPRLRGCATCGGTSRRPGGAGACRAGPTRRATAAAPRRPASPRTGLQGGQRGRQRERQGRTWVQAAARSGRAGQALAPAGHPPTHRSRCARWGSSRWTSHSSSCKGASARTVDRRAARRRRHAYCPPTTARPSSLGLLPT